MAVPIRPTQIPVHHSLFTNSPSHPNHQVLFTKPYSPIHPFTNFFLSEQELDPNLPVPRKVRLADHGPVDRAEQRIRRIVLVLPLVVDRLVQHVEQLEPDLEARVARKVRCLCEVEIELVERWTTDLI